MHGAKCTRNDKRVNRSGNNYLKINKQIDNQITYRTPPWQDWPPSSQCLLSIAQSADL